MNTSVSDNNQYPLVCQAAATDDNIFATFKNNSKYTDILEHVSYDDGREYINKFINNNNIINNIDKFKINDIHGSPKTYKYNIGTFSPTTLRYLSVLNDISQLPLDGIDIVEIGAGYGGQYSVLRQLYTPRKYIFVDLPEVLNLIKKYITKLNLDDIDIEYYDLKNIKQINSDLLISNYAFSECNESIQDIYIDKLINHSNHGYMIYNNMHGYKHNTFIELCAKKVKVFNEVPNTDPRNVLLTW